MLSLFRKCLRVLRGWPFWLGVFVFMVVFIAGHPWWIAAGLKMLMAREGVVVGEWKVQGYQHYHLEDVTINLPQGNGKVGSIQVNQPLRWLWQVRSGGRDAPYLRVDDVTWLVAVDEAESTEPAEPFPGASAIYELLLSWQPLLEKWVPHLRATNVSVIREDEQLLISDFTWENGKIALNFGYPSADLTASLGGPLIGPWQLVIRSPLHPAEFSIVVAPEQVSDQLQLNWQVAWAPLQASGGVRFSGTDAIPILGDGNWQIKELRGEEFGLPQLESLSGTLQLEWRDAKWRLSANLEGDWLEGDIRVPVVLSLQANGDTTFAELETLKIMAPWADANLTRMARFDLEQRQFQDSFAFDLILDLGKLAIPDLHGMVEFSVNTEAWVGEGEPPAVEFRLQADEIVYLDYLIHDLRAVGKLAYPHLQLSDMQFQWGEGTSLAGNFDFDFDTLSWQAMRLSSHLLHRDLEPWVSWPDDWPESSEWTLATDGDWREEFMADFSLDGHGGGYRTELRLNIQQNGGKWQANAANFEISYAEASLLSLREESEAFIGWDGAEQWVFRDWRMTALDGSDLLFHLEIDDGKVPLMELQLEKFDSAKWSLFFPDAWPDFRVDKFSFGLAVDLEAGNVEHWHLKSNGWVEMDVLPDYRGVRFDMDISGDPQGIAIKQFEWVGRDFPFIRGSGYLPMGFAMESFGLQFLPVEGRLIDWELEVVSRPTLVELLQGFLGTTVEDPMLSLQLGGEWQRPQGRLYLTATTLSSDLWSDYYPFTLDDIKLSILLDPAGLKLETLEFAYKNQPFTANATLPMDEEDWLALWGKAGFEQWNQVHGELSAESFQLEALAPLLPEFIGRTGQLDARLRLDAGWQLHGYAELKDASTRPLPTGSGLRNINGRLQFSGTQVELQNMTAYIERHRLDLRGSADFSQWKDPAVDLHFTGANLPLLRQEDMILRGDANIRLSKAAGQRGRIHGEVNFRESLFLRDMRAMIRPGVATASARPPFFSVEAEPFNLWTLDIRILSNRALRVQSPFFYGRISSDLQLLGRLEEPYLLGELSIPSGAVVFPFGNVRIEDGRIHFLQSDPYDPQLQIRGQSTTLGYTVQMDVAGSAYDPQLRFTSNPPLAQDQIILLLTAGMLPGGDDSGAMGQRIALFLGRGLAGDLFGSTEESWTQNLNIQGGGRLSESGRETYRIEYHLSDDFSVYGENDVFDEYNVGLRWRFYSR